ncbi:MAG: hypothetical protein ACTSSH_05550 [Candidatus Heimdallarchaeota archaeon]
MYQNYVDSIVESCKKDNSYVIMLKWGTIDEVQKKIQAKSELIQKIGNMVEKYQYGKHKISFYRTGKLMLSEVEHIENFLTELLG